MVEAYIVSIGNRTEWQNINDPAPQTSPSKERLIELLQTRVINPVILPTNCSLILHGICCWI